MNKIITIKLKKAGSKITTFSISDDLGNILSSSVTKEQLISGVSFTVNDSVKVIILSTVGVNCKIVKTIPITELNMIQIANIKFEEKNTASLWRHLTNTQYYNQFYGIIYPYIIEYPFSYQYYDEIVQNVKDYTKSYKYLPMTDGVFNDNRRIQTDTDYFNKSILYNDQQSTGILELVSKPSHNLQSYLQYPKYNLLSKTITFTKSDNFYQYNTFWSIVKDKTLPLFTQTCESFSIDKIVNQDNMDYSTRAFKKDKIRAKDLRVRQILDNKSDVHLVSQFIITPSQISYK